MSRDQDPAARRTRPQRLRRGLVVGAVVTVLVAVLALVTRDPSPVGHFRSEAGRLAYVNAYAGAMPLLPTPAETFDLPTDFGTVRVYRFGPALQESSVPVVLLAGRLAAAPMWEANVRDFAAERTTYALDTLGDAGLSVQTAPILTAADQAEWLDQVIRQLPSPTVHLVGHSFGGWLAANYAVHHAERVQTLTLFEPVFVFGGLRWPIYLKSLPASLPFLPQRWREAMLSDFGGGAPIDADEPLTRMISTGTEHYALKLPLPERPTLDQLRSLPMPVYVGLAGRSALHDTDKVAAVARATVPDLRLRVWPDATHSLPMEEPETLDAEALAMMRR